MPEDLKLNVSDLPKITNQSLDHHVALVEKGGREALQVASGGKMLID